MLLGLCCQFGYPLAPGCRRCSRAVMSCLIQCKQMDTTLGDFALGSFRCLGPAFQTRAKELIFNVNEMLGVLDQVAISLMCGGLSLSTCTPSTHRSYHLCPGLLGGSKLSCNKQLRTSFHCFYMFLMLESLIFK